jgi:hypothetical protein
MDERKARKVFVDSDVVVLAFAFERDKRHRICEQIVTQTRPGLHITFWNFLEVLGVLSHNLPAEKVEYFGARLNGLLSVEGDWPGREIIYGNVLKKMRASDALVLAVLESEKADFFVTWNIKDFAGRTSVTVITPDDFAGISKR